jgi:hypothetical protein
MIATGTTKTSVAVTGGDGTNTSTTQAATNSTAAEVSTGARRVP